MKVPVLIGVGLAILIIAAALAAPFLRDAEERAAQAAREQALLAQRQLARVSLVLPHIDDYVDANQLKADAAAADAAAEAIAERLRERTRDYDQSIQRAKEIARRAGLPEVAPAKPAAGANGVLRAHEAFSTLTKENRELLQRALKNATDAAQAQDAGNPIGVGFAAGLANYAKAAAAQLDAQVLRARQAEAQTRLLRYHALLVQAQSDLEHLRGLDPAETVKMLQRDLAELREMHGQASSVRAELAQRAGERQEQIAQVEAELKQVTAELREVEHRSFPAGDDAAFNTYRQRFTDLSQRAAALEQQLQELQSGSRVGAELPEEDMAAGRLVGGEAVAGAEELGWRLKLAEQRVEQLESAQRDVANLIDTLQKRHEQTQSRGGGYQASHDELAKVQSAIVSEIESLNEQATKGEQEGLQAAEAAIRAFGTAQRANEAWLTAARGKRSQLDPAGRNERLRRVTQDPYTEQAGRAAEAATRLLVGRVYEQQVEGLETLLACVERLESAYQGTQLDAAKLREQLNQARTAGIQALEKARDLYTTISDKLKGEPTGWIPRGSLATALYALARIDTERSAEHLEAAQKAIGEAVEKRERFPYAQPLVRLRAHLTSLEAEAAPTPATETEVSPEETPPPPEAEEPAAAETPDLGDEEDFFLRD